MTNETELQKVKRRIRALSARTMENGCTEAEAFAAMEKISELLSTFNLTMTEVELRAEKCVTGTVETAKTKTGLFYAWSGIRELCGVRVWRSTYRSGYVWNFFGLESDVEMAVYLTNLIETSLQDALAKFRQTDEWASYHSHRRTLTANFTAAFGSRIAYRLSELAAKNREEEKRANAYHAANTAAVEATDAAKAEAARRTTGTALITVAKAKMVEEEFQKLGMKLRTSTSQQTMRYNSNARSAGNTAANKVNLSRPIGGGKKASGYIA